MNPSMCNAFGRSVQRSRGRSLAILALVAIVWTTVPVVHAAVIVHDRHSLVSAVARSGGCPFTHCDEDIVAVFTAGGPDFTPFSESISASASMQYDLRPEIDAYFEGTASASAVQNSYLTYNAVNNQLFSATAGGLVTVSASGSPREHGGSEAVARSDFNLIFEVTDSPVAYTLTGSVQETPVIHGVHMRLSRVTEISRHPSVENHIHRMGDDEPLGAFDFSGQLDVGVYQLLVQADFSASLYDLPSGTAGFEFNLAFTELVPPATQFRWIGPETGGPSGTFGVDTHWQAVDEPTVQQVPVKTDTRADVALFDLAAAYTVGFDLQRQTSERMLVRNGHVTFDQVNYELFSTSEDEPSVVIDNARLTITSGQLTNRHALIGEQAAARVDLIGEDAQWINQGRLSIGGRGEGLLHIASGASVSSAESRIGNDPLGLAPGEVTVTGLNSLWETANLAIGFTSPGRLTVEHGASVTSGEVRIGNEARGNLDINDAALASNGPVLVGYDTEGWVLVDNGGALLVLDELHVGANAFGALFVNNGGFVAVSTEIVLGGAHEGAFGMIGVNGMGTQPSLLTAPNMHIQGWGELYVVAGGRVHINGSMNVGDESGGEGHIWISDVGSRVTADVLVVGLSNALGSLGQITLQEGGTVEAAMLIVGPGGRVVGTGTIQTHVRFIHEDGYIAPGLSPGKLTIDGDYEQGTNGTLQIEFAGLGEGMHDVLHVTGDALIQGMLELFFIDSFVPQVGDVLNFLRVDGELSGQFSQILFPQGLWTLELVASFDDGMFGFEVLAVNEIAAADRAVVPEPSTMALLMLGGLALFGRSRRVA